MHRLVLTIVAFIVDIAFCLSIGGLLAMHARMVWLNYTTIEMFEKARLEEWPYDRGPRRNFEEVFGTRQGLLSSVFMIHLYAACRNSISGEKTGLRLTLVNLCHVQLGDALQGMHS